MKKFLVVLSAVSLMQVAAWAVNVGEAAPDFKAPSTAGRDLSLGDFAGKWLVLYFYPKSFTPGCTAESCSLRDGYQDIQDLGASIVGAFRLDDVVVFGVVASLGDTPPVLGAIGNKTVLTNAPLSFAVTATPTEGDTVTLSVSNALPAGATFGSTNEVGTFEWLAPGPVGVYTMTFYAADNDGVDTEQITITVTSTPVDIDGDLLPNDWENQYFGGATNATATADDDGDGYLNVEEFVAQTIPVLPNGATSYFRNVSIAASGRSVGYPSVTGRQYRLWGSTNLIPGIDWTQVAGPQVGNGSAQSLQEGSGTTSSVFRLTVELTNP